MIAYIGKEDHDYMRGSPEKTARNTCIMKAHARGDSYREIALAYHLHHSRVGQIVKRLQALTTSLNT